MRQAMESRGFVARTLVYGVYALHSSSDYDYDVFAISEHASGGGTTRRLVLRSLDPYVAFWWTLSRFDIFHFYFNGGFLLGTPLQFLEVQLLHLAGKKVVVMGYGSDVAAPSHMRSLAWRHGNNAHYPLLGRHELKTMRHIDYFSRRADFIVAQVFHAETLPRWDLLTTLYYPIDTDRWCPPPVQSMNNGKDGPVSVVHAPNHRLLKGTDFLIAACRELEQEGYQIDLRLLERLPNTEVMRVMRESDIVADQFLHGYALTAMEGLSLGKPVMSNLSDDSLYEVHRLYTGLNECPIVSTPITEIKETLRRLITNPELRRELGSAGRRYALKYHSYDAVSRMWELVYRKLWHGEDIELHAWHPDHYPRSLSDSRPS